MDVQKRTFRPGAFLLSGDYSDMVIKYAGKTIRAHRIILCTRSKWFERIIGENSKFKEVDTRVVKMKGDNDMALDDMIQFLYTGEEPLDFKHTNIWHSWWTTIEMAIVADKYEVDDLLQPALEALKTIPDDTDFALRLAQMKRVAKRFPTEPAKRDQIIFNLGNVEFVESFLRRKRFRTWLDDCCPRVRDRLFIEHIAQLTMQGKFIAMLCKWESHQLVAFFQRGIARFAEGREDVEYLDEEDIDEDKDWDYGRWSGDEEEDSEDEDCENEEDENEKEQADGEVAEGEVEEEEKREAEGEGVVITVVHSDSGADAVEGC